MAKPERTEIVKNRDFDSILSSIGEFAKIGYVKFDSNTGQGFANKQWHINWGEDESTPLKKIIGVYRHLHPDDREKVRAYFQGLKNGGKLTFSEEVRVADKKGGWRWMRVYTIVADDDPKNLEIIAVNIDITSIKESEAALIEARDRAETMDRLKSIFLANMSHEIRTPLNAIVGFSNLMTDEIDSNLSDENRYYLSIIKNNSDLLLNLISDILDLSKIEAGTFDTSYQSVDVNSLCLDIYNMHLLKVHGDVELLLDRQLPECKIRSDRNRLTQLLTNFTTNAIKFTKKGYIKIGYLIVGEEIEFFVEDTGMGIEQKNLRSIFESFVKLNDFIGGTGLGLAICNKIVEQMGGSIGVDSKLGKGSRFWFRLPYIIQEDPQVGPNKKDSSKPLLSGEKPMILVAEDNESSFILLSSILNKKYAIKWARNGVEAVELSKKHKPKVIIMDIKMPVLDGLGAIKEIRKSDRDTPIIALTAYAFSADREKAFKAGCDEFLTKPITPEILKNALFRVLTKKL